MILKEHCFCWVPHIVWTCEERECPVEVKESYYCPKKECKEPKPPKKCPCEHKKWAGEWDD